MTEDAVEEAIDALLEEAEATEKEKKPAGRLVALKQQMAKAVKMEQYETAGQLKREIEKLERR
jgi:protein-arginine kinase activator protein McsA